MSTSQTPIIFKPGLLMAGKYRLMHPIGEGMMGAVWAALNETTSRKVALKLLIQPDQEMRQRLLREAHACGALQHKNVVEVLDVAQTDHGDPFLVMPLLTGETLTTLLRRKRRLEVPEAVRIARDIARGLAAAHALNIIHRDLKPSNIFLHTEPDESDYVVKILDFGVSKVLQSDGGFKTATGMMIGSPAYMSPEQVRASTDVDHQADVWALGVLLFEMMAGVRPFQKKLDQLLIAILKEDAPSITQYVRNIDARLSGLIATCLLRDRRLRPTSAEVAKQLNAISSSATTTPQVASGVEPATLPYQGIPHSPITAVPVATGHPEKPSSPPLAMVRAVSPSSTPLPEGERVIKDAVAMAEAVSPTATPMALSTPDGRRRSKSRLAAVGLAFAVILGILLSSILVLTQRPDQVQDQEPQAMENIELDSKPVEQVPTGASDQAPSAEPSQTPTAIPSDPPLPKTSADPDEAPVPITTALPIPSSTSTVTAPPTTSREKPQSVKPKQEEASKPTTPPAASTTAEPVSTQVEPAAPEPVLPPFDRSAARLRLAQAGAEASGCQSYGSPIKGYATVLFGHDGHTISVMLNVTIVDPSTTSCVMKAFRSATIPPYGGSLQSLSQSFTLK